MSPAVVALRAAGSVTLLVVLLSACERKPPSVSYYRTHAEERHAQVAKCADDPASARSDAACINALAAERAEGIGSFRNLPPLQLPPPQADHRPKSR